MDLYAQNGLTSLPVIQTARLTLRPMALSDAQAVTDQLNDLDVTRWLAVVPHPYTNEDAVWFIGENLAGRAQSWSIFAGDDLIGNVGAGNAHGYWLGRDHWGQGFATEAARAACDYHFANTDDAQLETEYFLGNAASCNVLTKIGFLPTAITTAHCAALGKEVQAQQMVLTRDRWEALQND
jgi:RimJ/RimL family protein N-acetyltransferase